MMVNRPQKARADAPDSVGFRLGVAFWEWNGVSIMGKFLAFIMGIAGALGMSQAPSFTNQYMQNLTGRIDELKPLVEQFDERVQEAGYTRAAAMTECAGSDGLLNALCKTYEEAVRRYELLVTHKAEIVDENAYVQPLMAAKGVQKDIAESVWSEFKPSVPATTVGAAYGGGGFVGFWAIGRMLFGLLGAPFRRNRYA